MTIEEKISRAQNDYDEVYHAGQLSVFENSQELQGSLTGEIVFANDVAKVTHNLECELVVTNLAPIPPEREDSYVSLQHNGDGTFSVTSQEEEPVYLEYFKIMTLPAGTYYYEAKGADVGIYNADFNNGNPYFGGGFILDEETEFDIYIFSTGENISLSITEDLSSVTVSRYGKNLAPPFYRRSNSVIITENNTAGFKVKPNTDYTIQLPKHEAMSNLYVHLVQDAKNVISLSLDSYDEIKRTFNTGNNTEIYLQINFKSAATEEARVEALELANKNTQLELGASATSYEPYIEPQTVIANADGTVDGLTSLSPNMTIMTDTEGAVLNVNYYKDPDILISNIIQDVALSGGEE